MKRAKAVTNMLDCVSMRGGNTDLFLNVLLPSVGERGICQFPLLYLHVTEEEILRPKHHKSLQQSITSKHAIIQLDIIIGHKHTL